MKNSLSKLGKFGLADVVQFAKAEKSKGTIQISTDLTEECGGYASGYIYKIALDETLYIDGVEAPSDQTSSTWCPMIRPRLLTNAPTISESTVIGLVARGKEVMFLTPILPDNIPEYKKPGGGGFGPVPGWTAGRWRARPQAAPTSK